MAITKKKKIVVKKKSVKSKAKVISKVKNGKKLVKSHVKVEKKARGRSTTGEAKDEFPEIIFDSKIGKTDALFVSLPDQGRPVSEPTSNKYKIDPAIDEALKEFDEVVKLEETEVVPKVIKPIIDNSDSLFKDEPKEIQQKENAEKNNKLGFLDKLLFIKKWFKSK